MQATLTSPTKIPKEEEKLNQPEGKSQIEASSIHREEKEKSLEERLANITLTTAEEKALEKVFLLLCGVGVGGCSPEKTIKGGKETLKCFNGKDIARVLKSLGMRLKKSEIDLMIWEVDENLDNCVDWKEFQNMYKKCIVDKKGLEPKTLFHMVQFLMYGSKYQEQKYQITVEDTLELIFVRQGRENLDSEIEAIFGTDEKNSNPNPNSDSLEKSITFSEYLDKINKRAIDQRRERMNEKKQYNLLNKSEQS